MCLFSYMGLCVRIRLCVCAEGWVCGRPRGVEEQAGPAEEPRGGDEDSDTDLTYGEVEQRLDLLQEHLNR